MKVLDTHELDEVAGGMQALSASDIAQQILDGLENAGKTDQGGQA